MKLIVGEGWKTLLDRFSYRGCIGLFYNNTWEGVLTYVIAAIICVLAIIGLITIIRMIFGGTGEKSTYSKKNKAGLTRQEHEWLYGKK